MRGCRPTDQTRPQRPPAAIPDLAARQRDVLEGVALPRAANAVRRRPQSTTAESPAPATPRQQHRRMRAERQVARPHAIIARSRRRCQSCDDGSHRHGRPAAGPTTPAEMTATTLCQFSRQPILRPLPPNTVPRAPPRTSPHHGGERPTRAARRARDPAAFAATPPSVSLTLPSTAGTITRALRRPAARNAGQLPLPRAEPRRRCAR